MATSSCLRQLVCAVVAVAAITLQVKPAAAKSAPRECFTSKFPALKAILDDYAPFQDQFCLVQPRSGKPGPEGTWVPPETSQNGIRFTAEMVLALARRPEFAQDSDLQGQIVRVFDRCEIKPGLLKRSPAAQDTELEGPDDYVGRIAASAVIEDGFAQRFLDWGKDHWGSYNNPEPEKWTLRSALWRQRQVLVHAKIAKGKAPTFIEQVWWAGVIGTAASADKNDHDAWVLSWFLVRTARGQEGVAIHKARELWIAKFKSAWPNGVGEVLGSYFGNQNHPAVKYLRGEFGE
jgi:hypothetical protein